MRLKNYNLFYSFSLLESFLKVDPDLQSILSKISGNKIADILLSIINRDVKLNQNYLKSDSEKNDEIRFVNDTQAQRFVKAGEDPFTKTGNVAKVGRIIRQILMANGSTVTDAELEKFVDLYKATWNKKYAKVEDRFRLVSGEDIRFWYNVNNYAANNGTLGNSCMRYTETQKYLDVYTQNPDVCSLLIYTNDNNDLIGRALVWKLRDGGYFMDRAYSQDNHQREEMYDWLQDHIGDHISYYKIEGRKLYVNIKNWRHEWFPYMDSLYFMIPTKESGTPTGPEPKEFGLLTNDENYIPKDQKPPLISIGATNGTSQGNYGWVWSRSMRYYYLQENTVRIQDKDGINDWCPKSELTYSEPEGVWLAKNVAEYCNLYGATYSRENLVDTKWGRAPKREVYKAYDLVEHEAVFLYDVPEIVLNGELKDQLVYTDSLSVNNGRVCYVVKDKCIECVTGNAWIPKDPKVRNRKDVMIVQKVKSIQSVDIGGTKYSINQDYLYSNNYSCYINLEYGKFPIFVTRRSSNISFALPEQIESFGLSREDDREYWAAMDDYYKVMDGVIYKEALKFATDNKLGVVEFLTSANSVMMGYDDYSRNQRQYEIKVKYGGIEEYLPNKFAEVLSSISIIEELQKDPMDISKRFFSLPNQEHLFFGLDFSKLNEDEIRMEIRRNLKTFINFIFVYILTEDKYDTSGVLSRACSLEDPLLDYKQTDINFFYLLLHQDVCYSTFRIGREIRVKFYEASDASFIRSELGLSSYTDRWDDSDIENIFNMFEYSWNIFTGKINRRGNLQ